MLGKLRTDDQAKLIAAMQTIENLLAGNPEARPSRDYILRAPKPGDFGWIVARHAELYAQEYGWTEPFEGLCAQIVADFANKYDPACERCWIAEINGENVGTVMLVKIFRGSRAPPPAAGRSEGRAGLASAPGWSTSASALRAPPATRRSRCGRTAFSPPPATSTRRPASRSPPANRAIAGARTSSPSIGI